MAKPAFDPINRMQAKVSGKPSMREMVREYFQAGDIGSADTFYNIVKKYHLSKPETEKLSEMIAQEE